MIDLSTANARAREEEPQESGAEASSESEREKNGSGGSQINWHQRASTKLPQSPSSASRVQPMADFTNHKD